MTVIYLEFPESPVSQDTILVVTQILQAINPSLCESERTHDSITFTSTDSDVEVYGGIFQFWANSEPPLICAWRVSGSY
ncbi:hypothetical protein N7452_011004 [Penicillium brevicompactum]|uniref:Uncharacterized protein n=1 Tax=Penicillium brevicompactum TaxID=5074 RepID=A0A9W9U6J7_PENBR|nr:hypothetical protein N7452_011004 [Penicillium brevicompactum]